MSRVFESLMAKIFKRRRLMEGALDRYEKIGFRASLSISDRYPIVCRELSSIIRLSYSTLRKPLQTVIFLDVLFAFSLLPEMKTRSAISAANNLIQSVEAAFPKQKKVIAVKEFKQAMVAHKRRNKCHQEQENQEVAEVAELPQEILLHLFSFLDMQSLVSAGMVCRSWNAVASDNYLWQAQFLTYFQYKLRVSPHAADGSIKSAFTRKYKVSPSLKFKNNRAFCVRCQNLVWLSDLRCPNSHVGSPSEYLIRMQILLGVSADQVAYFVCNGLSPSYVDAESSGSDEEAGSRLWANPMELVGMWDVYGHNP